MTRFLLFAVSGLAALRFGCCTVLARDDAVLLSTRLPHQFYFFTPGLSACLVKDKTQWNIALWACDPGNRTGCHRLWIRQAERLPYKSGSSAKNCHAA